MNRQVMQAGLALALGWAWAAGAVTTTATSSGLWDETGIWDNGVPQAGDTAVIGAGANVLLTNATAALESLTVNNTATLTFSNLAAQVQATNVTISSGGNVTHTINTDTNDTDGWQVDGRVYIVCSNFTLAAGGSINVDYKGFQPCLLYTSPSPRDS